MRNLWLVIATPSALELVKDRVVLVELTEFGAEVVVHRVRLHGTALHVQIPHLRQKDRCELGSKVKCSKVTTTRNHIHERKLSNLKQSSSYLRAAQLHPITRRAPTKIPLVRPTNFIPWPSGSPGWADIVRCDWTSRRSHSRLSRWRRSERPGLPSPRTLQSEHMDYLMTEQNTNHRNWKQSSSSWKPKA